MIDPSVRRLVNGVLWPGFLGRRVPAWLRDELGHGLAGVVLFGQNLGSAEERMSLAAELHGEGAGAVGDRVGAAHGSTGGRRLLVGIDEEGGNVTRLEAGTGSTLPGAAQLGFVDDVSATRAVGAEIARRAREVGANVVLAPDADVNVDPRNPVIGVRSFGDDPALVARHVVAQVAGLQSAGVAACVKHYPGHGDTHLDSHHALPTLAVSGFELERLHLPPFEAAIAAGVRAIMTAHIVVPEWGAAPATLNPAVLGRLRASGFDGVIVTDALDMAAVRATVGLGSGAVRALLAGAELLCIGNPANPGAAALPDQDERDFREVQHALIDAAADGTLPVDVLERAAARVAALAEWVAAAETSAVGEPLSPESARAIARAAVTVTGAPPVVPSGCLVLDVRRRATLAVDADRDMVASVLADGGRVVRIDPAVLNAQITAADAAADENPVVVLVDALESGAQRAIVEAVAAVGAGVVVNVGFPVDVALPFPIVHARAASPLAASAVREVLGAGVRA